MGFTTELVVQQLGDFDWKVNKPLRYKGRVDTFVVPTGSETDFASIPKIFQWLLPTSGRYTKPAVLHDYLCRNPEKAKCLVEDADGLFRRSMAELKVPFLRRWIMWTAVRWRSLLKSCFRAGPADLPQMLLVTIGPGLFVIVGGLVVLALLLGFLVIEVAAALVLALTQRFVPAVSRSTKRVVTPKLRWAA